MFYRNHYDERRGMILEWHDTPPASLRTTPNGDGKYERYDTLRGCMFMLAKLGVVEDSMCLYEPDKIRKEQVGHMLKLPYISDNWIQLLLSRVKERDLYYKMIEAGGRELLKMARSVQNATPAQVRAKCKPRYLPKQLDLFNDTVNDLDKENKDA
jgi:hypothetical protein